MSGWVVGYMLLHVCKLERFQMKFCQILQNIFNWKGARNGSPTWEHTISHTIQHKDKQHSKKNINTGTECPLYVHGYLICYRSKYMHTIDNSRYATIKSINGSQKMALIFQRKKQNVYTFANTKKMHTDPILRLNNNIIPVTDQYKYLGIIFEKKKKPLHSYHTNI